MAGRNSPFCWRLSLPFAAYPPHFFGACPKKRGGAPKKGAWGGGAPVRFRDPPASPTRVGAATRPLRCPLRGRIGSLAPGARGFGLDVDWRLKVFCPAFLQKSGRGPGAEPWPRAAARGIPPCSMKRRRGSKGGPSPGVPPFAGGLSRPQLALGRHYSGEQTPPAPQELRRHAKKGPLSGGPLLFRGF